MMEDETYLEEINIGELQQKICYHFKNIDLLKEALTHKSFANEKQLEKKFGNERFEFLGDAVLELVITHILMEKFPECPEGNLSKLRAGIVNKERLSSIAASFDLGKYLFLGRGEEVTSGRNKKSILANGYEAIIAAVYYDGGYQKVFVLIEKHFSNLIAEATEKGFFRDYKSRLQEYCQGVSGTIPEYVLVGELGPDHEKIFEIHVISDGLPSAKGRGRSKKEAEQDAAKSMLEKLTDGE
jgi:ribonuclease III